MKTIFLWFFCLLLTVKLLAQSAPAGTKKQLSDVICSCLATIDVDKITTKEAANAAFATCFTKRTDLLLKLATKHIDMTDQTAMRQIGVDIGKDLLTQNCDAFMKISIKMAQAEKTDGKGYTAGIFKRINVKGFNYIVVTENGSEKSFIWLRQFAGSDKFTDNVAALTGKKLNIIWQEIEVYLPQSKGYYKNKRNNINRFL